MATPSPPPAPLEGVFHDVLFLYPLVPVWKAHRVGKRLGRGGYAEVYEGEHTQRPDTLNYIGPIALKILTYEPSRREEYRFLRRLVKEVSIWSALQHPNIIPFLGLCLEDTDYKQLAIVMPLISRGTLRVFLNNDPSANRIDMLRGIAQGVLYLHTRDPPIIHGDLKCANVLVNDDGTPLLADFGLSVLMDDFQAKQVTTTLFNINPRWAAPERLDPGRYGIQQWEAFTQASDIYSLGITIYEMMSGQMPFPGWQDFYVGTIVLDEARPFFPGPTCLNNGLTASLHEFMNAAWSAVPSSRPRISELITLLSKAQDVADWMRNYKARERLIGSTAPAPAAPPSAAQVVTTGSASVITLDSFSRRADPLSQMVKKAIDIFRHIREHLGDGGLQVEELEIQCSKLGVALQTGSLYLANTNIKSSHLKAQRTLTHILDESMHWKERWYGQKLANHAVIKGDINTWAQTMLRAAGECTETLLREVAVGNQRLRPINETPELYGDESGEQYLDSVRAGYLLVYESAVQELRSTETAWLPEERATLCKELRRVVTITEPRSVLIEGVITPDYSTVRITRTSDVIQGSWIHAVNGGPDENTRVVAIKRLRLANPSEELVSKMKRECSLWLLLAHPNLIPFYGLRLLENGGIDLVSDWAVNGDVVQYSRAHPACNRGDFIKGAAYGLAFLHKCAVVHGSLRGANILLDKNCRPMLSDYGLAAASTLDGETSDFEGSSSQTIIAVWWMAPELIPNSLVAVTASDVFSFARTMLEIFTGQRPFRTIRNAFQVVALLDSGKLRVERPEDPEVKERGLTDDVWVLMNEMWMHEKEQRPTIDEVVRKLEELM